MKNLRFIALTVLFSTGAAVHASYEMMMFVEGNKISRYDPENKVSLGSFGEGELGAYSGAQIAADPVKRGEVAVMNGDGGIRRFNAFTGRYLGAVHTGVNPWFGNGPLRLDVLTNGNYLVSGYANGTDQQVSRIYSGVNGSLLSSMNPFGNSYWALDSVQGSDGNIYTLNRISGGGNSSFYTFVYSNNGSYLGANYLGDSSDFFRFTRLGRAGNRILVAGNDQNESVVHNIGFGQTVGSVGWTSWSFSGTTTTGELAWAHSRTYMHQIDDMGGGVYQHHLNFYDPATNYANYNSYILPYSGALGSMTIVTAPEPGTMVALAAGLGWLIRRKKKVN